MTRNRTSDIPEIAPAREPRIAIVCPGIGQVQRGFERLFDDLFRLMRDEFDITLFKGGGASDEREKVLWFARRNGRLLKFLPLHRLFGRTPMHVEAASFALALLPFLVLGRYDIVHAIDPSLTRFLYRLRNALGLKFRILYTEGCAMPPADYPPADHMQQIAQVTHEEALARGIPEAYMSLLPCGIYPRRFDSPLDRKQLRAVHGIDPDMFVILSVAALNRGHKRVHHLIGEAAELPGNFLLWLDGSLDHGEADLIEYAKQRLGERCRITHVASDKVGELYRMADVMVHCSLFEAFGLAIVEAASTGLPVVTHDAPHFRWLLPNPESRVDMTRPGALRRKLESLMSGPDALRAASNESDARARFSWENLRAGYAELYRKTARLPLQDGSRRHCAGLK